MEPSDRQASGDRVRARVSSVYERAVSEPAARTCSTGRKGIAFQTAGYAEADLASAPTDAVVNAFGCGNPLAFAEVGAGDVVLDLGSGAGLDLVLAARLVGPTGRVVGVDMTPAMVERARRVAREAGCTNVTVERGLIEDLPVADASVDWVVSNCVINLSPEKDRVFAEIARVLRPGGRMRVADLVASDLPARARGSALLESSCLAGAISEEEYLAGLARAGLTDVEVDGRLVYDEDQLAPLLAAAGENTADEETRAVATACAGRVWSARVHARKPEADA
jgi:SAM-dependent methyltransferase